MSGVAPQPRQPTQSQEIPSRRVLLNDPSQLPHDYSTTPGGTLFSTTPGGTRIIYDRAFLIQCRNSPLTKSPPPNMAKIPGVTSQHVAPIQENGHVEGEKHTSKDGTSAEEPQFEMDI